MPNYGTVEVGEAKAGEGRPRRYAETADALVEHPPSAPQLSVMGEVIPICAERYGEQEAVGWREIVETHTEEKEITKPDGTKETKTWQYFQLSGYQWWTHNQLAQYVKDASSGLVKLGHSKETIFNLYASTSPKWQVMAHACARQGITFATAYDSLGQSGLEHSIQEPGVYGLYTNAALLSTVASAAQNCESLKVVIWDGKKEDVKGGALDKLASVRNGAVKVLHFDELVKLGQENPAEASLPKPDDICTIMYTSGSTGPPKGVQLTNRNVIACLAACEIMLGHLIKGATYLAYLPSAHILEYMVEVCMLFFGARTGYGNIRTLTDASVRKSNGDIRELAPTIMVGVPAVWEQIRKGILTKVKQGGAVKQFVFNAALKLKQLAGRKSYIAGAMDAVVFSAVRQATGGRLKYGVSGGAPLSADTQEWLSNVLVEVIQGFGMTETAAFSCILPFEMWRTGCVGIPTPAVEIKLVDFEEANYRSTNDPPQGEVWMRGPSIAKGYYKLEKQTKETWTEDGWLMTGDIGQWNSDGTLSIIDRKKNLVKLSGGEYVALERLESIYKGSQVVANICVHATSQASKPMAIIFPNEANLRTLAKEKHIDVSDDKDLSALCHDKKIVDAVLADCNAVGKKQGLKALETLQVVVLSDEEWTPQNNLVTSAQKLQRKNILSKYKKEIDAVYP